MRMGRHRFLLNSDFIAVPLMNINHTTIISSSPSLSSSGASENVAGNSNFDGNMVIILAALLCALISALGLNSILRCALRCSRRLAFEATGEARSASTGLKKDALSQIPVVVYKSGAAGVKNFPATDCPICLGEFKEGEKVRILLRCNHGFHVKCIDTWLGSHSSCPICRQMLFQVLIRSQSPPY